MRIESGGLAIASGQRVLAWAAAMAILAMVSACCGPMDEALVTNGTQDTYRASLVPVVAKMTPHEVEAFDWAVSDFDLAKLNAKYPGASPRDIVRGEVQDVLATYPARIDALMLPRVEN